MMFVFASVSSVHRTGSASVHEHSRGLAMKTSCCISRRCGKELFLAPPAVTDLCGFVAGLLSCVSAPAGAGDVSRMATEISLGVG
jgi:hypothetical protein